MDQTQLQQKIGEYFQKLPKEAQEVFSSMVWMEKLKEINLKFNLNEDQVKTLGTETTLVLLGIIEVPEYQSIIEKELGLEKVVVEKIIIDIDQNILKSIKSHLDTAFKQNANDLVEKTYGGDKKLDERFASLPKEIQVVISESNFQPTLYAIAKKYKLTIEQMGILEEVTTKILLGVIHPDSYRNELATKTSIPPADITNIVLDVNEEILKTIREALKKHWDEKDKKSVEQAEDIPLPPYAPKPVTKTVVPSNINVTNKPAYHSAQLEIDAIMPKGQSLESAEFDLEMPEEPLPPKNIMAEKLSAITTSEHTVTDYTMPKISSPTPSISQDKEKEGTPRHDPYREDFK